MTCENQPIAEMLVPYVEGALAEAERAEVTDHLRHCPACREEARVLRDTIMGLRGVFGSGYRPSLANHPPAEELSAFVLEPETLPEDRRAALNVHMLECDDCSGEAQLLREMHKDLEGRVAPGGAPLVLPRALREEIEAAYPAGRPVPARLEGAAALPFMERLAHMLSRFNWRPVLATGLAAVVLTFGFLFAYSGRQAEMAVQTTSSAAAPAAAPAPAVASPAAPPTEVPLLVAAGKADEAAQALEKEKIPFQNRDGRLYLAPGDVERARRVVDQPEPEPEPAAASPQLAMADDAAGGEAAVREERAKAEAPAEDKDVAEAEVPAPPPPAPVTAPVERPRQVETPVERPRPVQAQAPQPARTQTATVAPPRTSTPAQPRPAAPAARPQQRQEIASAGASNVSPMGESGPAPRPVPMDAAPGGGVGIVSEGSADEADAMAAPNPMAQSETVAKSAGGYAGRTATTGAEAPAQANAPAPAPAPAPAAPAAAPAPSRADTLEPRARQVATAEGSVTVEESDDGSVRVVVRARRTLSAQEEESLRQRLRRELGLREGDTITIRQP